MEDELVRNIVGKRVHSSLVGIEELTREISKKASETNPYLLEEGRIALSLFHWTTMFVKYLRFLETS